MAMTVTHTTPALSLKSVALHADMRKLREDHITATLAAEMHMHLRRTTDEAVAHLQRKWTADVAAYDRVQRHSLHMSDLLAGGIVEQFPARFSSVG